MLDNKWLKNFVIKAFLVVNISIGYWISILLQKSKAKAKNLRFDWLFVSARTFRTCEKSSVPVTLTVFINSCTAHLCSPDHLRKPSSKTTARIPVRVTSSCRLLGVRWPIAANNKEEEEEEEEADPQQFIQNHQHDFEDHQHYCKAPHNY